MTKIFTWGYLGGTLDDLDQYAKALDATVLDVRLVPYSRRAEWNANRLWAHFGNDHYRQVGDFGNLNYRDPKAPFQLRDQESGLAQVRGSPKPMIVLCACRSHSTCHRSLVADLIAEDMRRFTPDVVEVEHLPGPFSRWVERHRGIPVKQGALL